MSYLNAWHVRPFAASAKIGPWMIRWDAKLRVIREQFIWEVEEDPSTYNPALDQIELHSSS